MAPLFFALWSSLFHMQQFARLLVFFIKLLFHVLGYGWLFPFFFRIFPPAAVLAVPSCFSPPFSLVCFFLFYGLLPVFSASCASGCSSLLTCLRLSSMLRILLWLYLCCPGAVFPAFLLVFFRLVFLRLFRVSSLSLGLRSLPWCLFLLVFVVVFFAPVLVLSPPVLPCYVAVAFGCLFSDLFESPVPVATWSPFGTRSGWLQPLFFLVSSCLPMLVSFSVRLRSVPLPRSHWGLS